MTNKEFDKLLKERIVQIEKVLGSKAQEYASDLDRLHNFDIAAIISRKTKAQALWGMAMKHLVSVIDIVDSGQKPTKEIVDEKIGDLINYLILLEAIFKE